MTSSPEACGNLLCRVACDGKDLAWHAREGTVTVTRDATVDRLVFRDTTADSLVIEWNPSTRQATLRREGLWSRPLYYWMGAGELLVSDSLRALARSLPFAPTLDAQALDAYLALEFFPAPLTPFREIRKVGVEEICHLDLATGSIRSVTAPLPERSATVDFESGVEAVRCAFAAALDERARQCPSELILLCSGGLDSTLLAHLMGGRGRAVVLSYADSWKDEVERARQTARSANLPLQETRLPAFDVEHLERYALLLDEPLGGTGNFALSHLCAVVPPASWIVGGHGSGVLSLMNVNHKHLHAALNSGLSDTVVQRFCRNVTYMDAETRRRLLGAEGHASWPDPVEEMLRREWVSPSDPLPALLAVIRRQLCVEEEMSQLWPIYDAFGHVPVMPFFEPGVRTVLDGLPETVLRDESFERRLLKRMAVLHCPGYVAQPRQLGYGLPLGEPAYPSEPEMRKAVAAFSTGPLCLKRMAELLDRCKDTHGAERFHLLRRLWAAVLLQAWLQSGFHPFRQTGWGRW